MISQNTQDGLVFVLGLSVSVGAFVLLIWVAAMAHDRGAERMAAARAQCVETGGIWMRQTCLWSLKGKDPSQ